MGLELIESPVQSKQETPTIEINLDAKCVKCGDSGATVKNGKCMKCIGKEIGDKIKADREPKFFEHMKEQQFQPAHEAKLIAEDLIERFHSHLSATRIEFIYIWKTPEAQGRETWGRARKYSGLNAWMATEDREAEPLPDTFFIIEFSWQVWRELDINQKTALVDHELAHCSINDDLKPCLKGHDCEEFNQIIRRHGLWKNDVKNLLEAAKEAEKNPLFSDRK